LENVHHREREAEAEGRRNIFERKKIVNESSSGEKG